MQITIYAVDFNDFLHAQEHSGSIDLYQAGEFLISIFTYCRFGKQLCEGVLFGVKDSMKGGWHTQCQCQYREWLKNIEEGGLEDQTLEYNTQEMQFFFSKNRFLEQNMGTVRDLLSSVSESKFRPKNKVRVNM